MGVTHKLCILVDEVVSHTGADYQFKYTLHFSEMEDIKEEQTMKTIHTDVSSWAKDKARMIHR